MTSISSRAITHGMCYSRIYNARRGLISRCNYKHATNSKNYKNRGITVCDRWLESFENFYEDMGSTYKDGLTMDRIDNDKGYYKENCRWVTNQQNQANRGADLNSSSKYKGVSLDKKTGMWKSRIKGVYLGLFTKEEDAAIRYNEEAFKQDGKYAYQNMIKRTDEGKTFLVDF